MPEVAADTHPHLAVLGAQFERVRRIAGSSELGRAMPEQFGDGHLKGPSGSTRVWATQEFSRQFQVLEQEKAAFAVDKSTGFVWLLRRR